jgi:hypothetical protein
VIVLCENQAFAQRAIEKPYAPVSDSTTTTLVPRPYNQTTKPAPKTPEGKLMTNRTGVTDGAMSAAPNTGFFRPKSSSKSTSSSSSSSDGGKGSAETNRATAEQV